MLLQDCVCPARNYKSWDRSQAAAFSTTRCAKDLKTPTNPKNGSSSFAYM